MKPSKDLLEGQCLCGKVKYQVKPPLKFVAHDHCSMCRKASGAPFVTWGGVKEDQIQYISGKEFLSSYQSSKEARREFCSQCGSPLFFRSSRWPGEVHFTIGTLNEFSGRARSHVFYSDRADWFDWSDSELPKYGGKTGTEKLD